ncbi:class I SAM-dependent methyltransferase [Bacteroidota bacterium]
MKQRKEEWLDEEFNKDYHNKQFIEPYRSTVLFCDWLDKYGKLNTHKTSSILDIGTGKGANLLYLSGRYPNLNFTGIDINEELIAEGKKELKNHNITNCELEIADIYTLHQSKYVNKFEGIISFQTLFWLPEFQTPLKRFVQLNPDWIALTSLFYNGKVNCKIEVEQFMKGLDKSPVKSFYNVYSLDLIQSFFQKFGYTGFHYIPFEIDIDLKKPENKLMGTYTEKLSNGKRIQISGPVLMNWYFVLATK